MAKEIFGEPVVVEGQRLPLTKAVRAGDFVFTSGTVAIVGQEIAPGTIEEETRIALGRLERDLAEAGCTLADVVKATVWLTDADDFAAFNRAYAEVFPEAPPARSTVRCGLMAEARIEIEVLAYRPHETESQEN
jgi:enamine deaminase RidA (YjgF/YER057c/UK114 family)